MTPGQEPVDRHVRITGGGGRANGVVTPREREVMQNELIDPPSDRAGWRLADELQCAEEVLTALTTRLRGLFEDEQPCFTPGEVTQVDVCGVLMCKGGVRIDFELDLDGDLRDALRGLARQLRAVADACD